MNPTHRTLTAAHRHAIAVMRSTQSTAQDRAEAWQALAETMKELMG